MMNVTGRLVGYHGVLRNNMKICYSVSRTASTIFDFKVKDIDGNTVNLSKYKGKVTYIVNVASN